MYALLYPFFLFLKLFTAQKEIPPFSYELQRDEKTLRIKITCRQHPKPFFAIINPVDSTVIETTWGYLIQYPPTGAHGSNNPEENSPPWCCNGFLIVIIPRTLTAEETHSLHPLWAENQEQATQLLDTPSDSILSICICLGSFGKVPSHIHKIAA